MRILCLITIGSFLLSIVTSENDVPSGTNVQRVPRALVLKPVLKVDSAEEEEDGNPFSWIANAFTRMMRPARKVPSTPKLLGPIRVPGLNDDVFIKQLESMSNANNRVVIRVMPQSNVAMGMQMDSGQYYNNQQYLQPQQPYYYNNHQQVVPSTRQQQPMQSSGGFVPVSPPTPSSWTRPGHQYYQQLPQYQQSYTKNPPLPLPNYNYAPQHQRYPQPPSRYQYSYPPSSYQPFSPYYPPYSQQNPYGSYDFDNSIPQKSDRTSYYNYKSTQSTNYPVYPPLSDQSQDFEPSYNNTEFNSYQENSQVKTEYDHVDFPKAKPTPAKVPSNEVFRSDRMVPTNPTWKNRFWAKARKTTTTTSTTEQPKKSDTDDNRGFDDDDDQRGKKRSLSKQEKYSLTDIEEIAPPELTDKEKSGDSSSRMDEDGIVMKDGTLLGRGESQEHTPGNRQHSFNAEENLNWKPMAVSSTSQDKSADSSSKNVEVESKNSTKVKDDDDNADAEPEMGKRVMSLGNNNYWKHQNIKRPLKSYAEKIIFSGKNKNKKIRIVENVQSSVSIVTSRGNLKNNSSKIKT